MNNLLMFILEIENRTAFGNAIRGFFGFISKFIFQFFSGAIDLMYELASFKLVNESFINTIGERITNILIIFMLFKVSFSFLTYLVNPDIATDKDKGFQGIIKRIIISLILLISINPIFKVLEDLQAAIIEDNIITSILSASEEDQVITVAGHKLIGVKINENCPENKLIYTVSEGDRMALLLFKPFLQPYSKNDINKKDNGTNNAWDSVFSSTSNKSASKYCGYDISNNLNNEIVLSADSKSTLEAIKSAIPGPNSAEGLLMAKYYNLSVDEAPTGNNIDDDDGNGTGTGSQYFYKFNYFFAFVTGLVGLLITISFCFDVVIRSLTLLLLQIIAPIPIISYISPKGKSSEMLGSWGKKLASVWASLFIRIITLNLAILFIDNACKNLNASGNTTFIMQIFIILGVLMFAKKLPGLLEELIPGLKLSNGFQLNPLKRIRNDAVGGDLLMNTAGRGVGALSGALGGAAAGFKAGKEIGATGKGIALGALSGASSGFSNKKLSFSKGMSESYKNLTGNEFRRMTPVSMLMPKMGQKPVKETKDYLKKAYEQLNTKSSDLNISENMSSQLANDLMGRGYDINDINGMKNKIENKMNTKQAEISNLKSKTLSLENDKNNARSLYDGYQAQYNNAIGLKEAAQTDYDKCVNDISILENEIVQQEKTIGRGLLGSFDVQERDKLEKLKNQKQLLERNLQGYKTKLDDTNSDVETIRKEMDKASITMNNKLNDYNNHIQQIETAESELKAYKKDIESIKKYQENRENEAKIRSDISSINKDIDTLKKEKSQRERFYRIDPAPQQDYNSAKSNVDGR